MGYVRKPEPEGSSRASLEAIWVQYQGNGKRCVVRSPGQSCTKSKDETENRGPERNRKVKREVNREREKRVETEVRDKQIEMDIKHEIGIKIDRDTEREIETERGMKRKARALSGERKPYTRRVFLPVLRRLSRTTSRLGYSYNRSPIYVFVPASSPRRL